MGANARPAVELVHRLLFEALVEMRAQGHDQKNKVVFHLADLFHNAVLEMENAARGHGSYEEVLRMVEERAKERAVKGGSGRRSIGSAKSSPKKHRPS